MHLKPKCQSPEKLNHVHMCSLGKKLLKKIGSRKHNVQRKRSGSANVTNEGFKGEVALDNKNSSGKNGNNIKLT